MKLLVISNGHGEDLIAVRIIEQLQIALNDLEIMALPIVGEGYAYQKLQIPLIGKVQTMPSGGFVYMSKNHLFSDLKGGLLQLTLDQLKVVKQWGKTQNAILAVGDIVPLLFAWLSGSRFAFVGTAKSEYYLKDCQGKWLEQTSWLERQFGSVYLPWERWLMSRAVSVYPRDSLTTKILQQQEIKAWDLGNPMMDGLVVARNYPQWQKTLKILLLPGSRSQEALRNWPQILAAVHKIIAELTEFNLILYTAIAPSIDLTLLQQSLIVCGWELEETLNKEQNQTAVSCPFPVSSEVAVPIEVRFRRGKATLWLAQNAYEEYSRAANLAIAMAGTATEQFVGLGKPVITMPGSGPQCTFAFMEAQSRLLGYSILLRETPTQVLQAVKLLLDSPELLQAIADNGKARMGNSGASQRIAAHLQTTLFSNFN
jgi:uncharacterized protein (TIGR03492 family)